MSIFSGVQSTWHEGKKDTKSFQHKAKKAKAWKVCGKWMGKKFTPYSEWYLSLGESHILKQIGEKFSFSVDAIQIKDIP